VIGVTSAVIGPALVAVLVAAARRAVTVDRARTLGHRDRRRLPNLVRAPLTRALADADVDVEPEAAAQLWLASAGLVAVLALAISPTLALPAAAGGALAGPVGLRLVRDRRRRRLAAALPGALEQVAAELRGGSTVGEGLAALAGAGGPLSPQLRRVCARAGLGAGLVPALAAWPREQPTPGVREAAGALAVAASAGGRAAGALEGLAASLRDRLGAVAEARALSAQARLSAVVVGLAPIGYLVFSSLVDRRNLTVLVATGVGRACLMVGLALEALAAWWMRRLVRVEA